MNYSIRWLAAALPHGPAFLLAIQIKQRPRKHLRFPSKQVTSRSNSQSNIKGCTELPCHVWHILLHLLLPAASHGFTIHTFLEPKEMICQGSGLDRWVASKCQTDHWSPAQTHHCIHCSPSPGPKFDVRNWISDANTEHVWIVLNMLGVI